MLHIWRKIISSLFIRKIEIRNKNVKSIRFEILTVPFPKTLTNTFYSKKINEWEKGKLKKRLMNFFEEKTNNLQGTHLRTVVYQHFPMVMKDDNNLYWGIEINILNSLATAMNFNVDYYETLDQETERWGRINLNGSNTYTGITGEMINRRADIALGDIYINEFHSAIMDFVIPHSVDCLTFLTPESRKDNAWQTLIKPFSADLWTGVILALLLTGTIFYTFSWVHNKNIENNKEKIIIKSGSCIKRTNLYKNIIYYDKKLMSFQYKRLPTIQQKIQTDIFDEFSNCILLTFSMLLLVSLPRMPKSWPVRVLSGWYWIYCVLVACTYRASFTAILANPPPRITIDTIDELAKSLSSISVGAWGQQNKHFFQFAFDEDAQKIGIKLEEIIIEYGIIERIAKGEFAYFDNEFYLRKLRAQGTTNRKDIDVLHIMKNCMVSMPISLALQKNSPLKSNFDKYVVRLFEGGVIVKWLKDITINLPADVEPPQEAVINLKKFWSSFVALGIGYLLSILGFIGEKLHFIYVVQKHPLYDKLNLNIYYNK